MTTDAVASRQGRLGLANATALHQVNEGYADVSTVEPSAALLRTFLERLMLPTFSFHPTRFGHVVEDFALAAGSLSFEDSEHVLQVV
jgi:hypothetical protein